LLALLSSLRAANLSKLCRNVVVVVHHPQFLPLLCPPSWGSGVSARLLLHVGGPSLPARAAPLIVIVVVVAAVAQTAGYALANLIRIRIIEHALLWTCVNSTYAVLANLAAVV
jgi:hypothetical protein